MMKIVNRTPLSRIQLIQLDLATSSPTKRNIKISNQRFPLDFFHEAKEKTPNMQPRAKIISEAKRQNSRNLPQTHQEIRSSNSNNQQYQNVNQNQPLDFRVRQMSTSLECRANRNNSNIFQKEQDLILSVLASARDMKKMIRKHSIQLRKDRQFQKDQGFVELPPLRVKRGLTTAF